MAFRRNAVRTRETRRVPDPSREREGAVPPLFRTLLLLVAACVCLLSATGCDGAGPRPPVPAAGVVTDAALDARIKELVGEVDASPRDAQRWARLAMTYHVHELLAEADALVAGTSDVLARFYQGEVRPGLAGLAPSWNYLLDVRAGRERVLEPFRRVAPFVAEPEKEIVDDLATIRLEKMELDVQYTLQGVLRGWLVLHVPPAVVLMALLVVHVLAWLLY